LFGGDRCYFHIRSVTPIPTVDLTIPLIEEIFDEAKGHIVGLSILPTISGIRWGVYRVFYIKNISLADVTMNDLAIGT
jgi:hypothetical protein